MSMEPGMHHRMGVILLQYQQKSVVASTLLYLHEALAVDNEGRVHTFHK